LAALTQRDRTPVDQVPATLYEFLAEELFQDVDQSTQDGLVRLALAPTITESLAEFVLGVGASGILETAVHRGLLDRDGLAYEFHPLLRAFLQRKLSESGDKAVESIARAVSEHLIDTGLWDDAFALISNSRMPALLPGLIEASLDSLLLEGRTATLKRWINASDEAQIQSPIVDLAEAELSFREGIHSKTEALALAAARRVPAEHPIASRAYSLAGRSAYFEGRHMDALKLHETAFDLSRSPHTTRTALWGQFLTYLELENDTAAVAVFEELENVEADTTEDLLRLATGRFQLAMRRVESGLSELLAAVPLLSRSRDPLSRSAFLNVCAGGLVLSARYNDALQTIEQQIAEAQEYRLNFALPHAYLRKAGAMLGKRAFREAHWFLDRAERLAPETRDPRLVGSAHATRAITYLACGRFDEAMAAAAHVPFAQSSKAANAELAATRALISACAGDSEASVREARTAVATSKVLEITILSQLASAIVSCQTDDPGASRSVNDSIAKTLKGGALDFFVAAYRGYPPLLNYVDDESWLALSGEISQIPDQPRSAMAKPGLSMKPVSRNPDSLLSNRETEVFGLLAQGLTNKQIAHSLFVSESTVKVHVRHILEKLGVRTRTAAASLHRNELDQPSQSSPPGAPGLDDLELPM
jgi:DNA-binding CsgD family transcriptional regulator/tetratricopeptide (TPR) repeat protein